MSDKLKPCPFCGKPVALKRDFFRKHVWHIVCDMWEHPAMQSNPELQEQEAKDRLILTWNTRAQPDGSIKAVDNPQLTIWCRGYAKVFDILSSCADHLGVRKTLKYGAVQRELAEALLWRDEDVSAGAFPAPMRLQPDRDRYYADAEYLLDWLNAKFNEENTDER